MSNDQYFEMNRKAWDERARVHLDSSFYDVPGFLQGKSSLTDIERSELKDVAGKSLLHLQCHFGMDTLSWAREGARVTGVDLSPVAIQQAEDLARQAGLSAEFICSNLYDFEPGDCQWDIVFSSFGAVCWLPDLGRWATLIERCLKPGGQFYLAEFHPLYDILLGYSYFFRPEADVESEGTYTDNGDSIKNEMAVWAHPLSQVINELLGVGLELKFLNEFDYSPYNCFPDLIEKSPGRYYHLHRGQNAPMVYSLMATKPAPSV